MLLGVPVWQDFPLADQEPALAGSVVVVPNTDYDGEWWRKEERRIAAGGGAPVNYLPRGAPSATIIAKIGVFNRKEAGEVTHGAVQVLERVAIISARHWYLGGGMMVRPRRGDEIETPLELFYVRHVEPVQRKTPAGLYRDLSFRIFIEGGNG